MKRPFTVNVASMRGHVGDSDDVDLFDELDELVTSGSAVPKGSIVRFTGNLLAIDGGIQATGHVHADWTGECRRCLGVATGIVDAEVREIFQPKATEGESYPIDGDVVDLEPLVRETVMLELPIAALCKLDCQGLCPTCGANWNETSCDCDNQIVDPRWAVLDALKSDEGQNDGEKDLDKTNAD